MKRHAGGYSWETLVATGGKIGFYGATPGPIRRR
jgi:hypothetical protein